MDTMEPYANTKKTEEVLERCRKGERMGEAVLQSYNIWVVASRVFVCRANLTYIIFTVFVEYL